VTFRTLAHPTRPALGYGLSMPLEAAIAGEGFRLVLRVLGYEHPGFDSGSDANWLAGEAALTASSSGSFSGRHSVSLRTEELVDFRDQRAEVVQNLDGSATLQHLEGQVGCTITLRRGSGEFEGFVREHVGADLRVSGLRTDQSYLQESLRGFDALVRKFPVKGDPFA
jgi:hypothetical protein